MCWRGVISWADLNKIASCVDRVHLLTKTSRLVQRKRLTRCMTDDTTWGLEPSLKLHTQLRPKVLELAGDSGCNLYSYRALYDFCFHCSAFFGTILSCSEMADSWFCVCFSRKWFSLKVPVQKDWTLLKNTFKVVELFIWILFCAPVFLTHF